MSQDPYNPQGNNPYAPAPQAPQAPQHAPYTPPAADPGYGNHGAAPPKGSNRGKMVIFAMVASTAAAGGVWFADPTGGKAEVTHIEIVQPLGNDTAFMDLSWIVTELPKGADGSVENIELRLSSDAFAETAVYDWAYLAENDDRPESDPNSLPPAGAEMSLRILVEEHLQTNITITEGADLGIRARFFWDGRPKGSDWVDIMDLYNF